MPIYNEPGPGRKKCGRCGKYSHVRAPRCEACQSDFPAPNAKAKPDHSGDANELVSVPKPTLEDQVHWTIGKMADLAITPAEPGQPWPGEAEIVSAVQGEFTLTDGEATAIVAAAAHQLWTESPDNPARVERRLMERRLTDIRNLVIAGIKKPRKTMTYRFVTKKDAKGEPVKDENGQKVYVRVPRHETHTERMDPSAVRLLIDLEKLLVVLKGIDQDAADDPMARELLEQMDRMSQGGESKQAGRKMSVAQRLRQLVGAVQQAPQVTVINNNPPAPSPTTKAIEAKVIDVPDMKFVPPHLRGNGEATSQP
jgi:hypothetical protein